MHMTFTLEPEQVDKIIISELNDNIDSLVNNLKQDVDDDDYIGVFSHDREEDAVQIQKHIDALKLIIKFYGGESTIF